MSHPTFTDRSAKQASRGRELALNIGAVAGLVCIIAAAASMFLGIKPLVFRSGSMEPAISTGALALTSCRQTSWPSGTSSAWSPPAMSASPTASPRWPRWATEPWP